MPQIPTVDRLCTDIKYRYYNWRSQRGSKSLAWRSRAAAELNDALLIAKKLVEVLETIQRNPPPIEPTITPPQAEANPTAETIEHLRALIALTGLSQAAFAELVGVSRSYIANTLGGQKTPSYKALRDLGYKAGYDLVMEPRWVKREE